MIISALAKYFDCLVQMEDSPLVAEGFSKVKTHYVAVINQNGELKDFMPHYKTRLLGKKEIEDPIEEVFPERVATTTIMANLIEHRPKYIFGLETNKSGEFVCGGNLQKAFDDCKRQNIALLDNVNCTLASAMKKFYENWIPAEQLDNPVLKSILKKFDASYYTFCLDSDPCSLINRDFEILEKLKELKAEKEKEVENEKVAQCSICGEY
ncbi:MAG: type I-C CRISPR-associated protein Cas8c/Csd1, partial [Clostridia bacterium]